MKHANIKIYGQVQGVNFRHWAKMRATDYNLTGLVENKADGSLYIEVEGDVKNLLDFVEECRHGPTSAEVIDVQYQIVDDLKDFKRFEILG